MNRARRNILAYVFGAILLISLCVGVTYAFLTDSATSSDNKIQFGTMTTDLMVLNENGGTWLSIKGDRNSVFNSGEWTPGQTEVKILQFKNSGNLALQWQAKIVCQNELSELAEVIDVYVKAGDAQMSYPADKANLGSDWILVGTLDEFVHNAPAFVSGDFLPQESDYFGIALRMQNDAGTEYQSISLGGFYFEIQTLQLSHEEDFFDNQYDAGLQFPCNHKTIETISGTPATCTATGIKDGKKCSDCGAVIVPQTAIPTTGHTAGEATVQNVENPTATTNGSYESVVCCAVCGVELSRNTIEIIPENTAITVANRAAAGYAGGEEETLTIKAVFEHDGKWYRTTSIGEKAFYECAGLKTVAFEEGTQLVSIDREAFRFCNNLVSIAIPNSVTSIGAFAFRECGALRTVTIPTGVTALEEGVFQFCSGLEEITIPDNVTEIHNSAFNGCESLTNVSISQGVQTVGIQAFMDCISLSSITFNGTVEEWNAIDKAGNWNYNSNNLTHVYCVADGKYAHIKTVDAETGTAATCTTPQTCTVCGTEVAPKLGHTWTDATCADPKTCSVCGATEGSALGHNYIETYESDPSSTTVTIIYACSRCAATYSETVTVQDLTITSSNRTWVGYTGAANEKLNIPEVFKHTNNTWYRVVAIGNNAFKGCTGLMSVTIPNTVTTIGSYAFQNCTSLQTVTFEEGSQLTTVDTYAFDGCTALGEIEIPNSVTTLGNYSFRNCSSLTEVTFGNGSQSAMRSYARRSVNAQSQLETIGNYVFSGCTALESIIIPNGVTSIGTFAFGSCTSITEITIPDSVTSIGTGVFYNCSNLESITLPFVGDSIKTSSDKYQYPLGYIFGTSTPTDTSLFAATVQTYYGSSIGTTQNTTYYIPTSLKSVTITGGNILRGAFYNCSGLTSVTISEGITSIGQFAFYKCSSLTNVNIPTSVTIINSSAFSSCSSLQNIQIPYGVQTIGTSAFQNCTALTSITVSGSVTEIGANAFQGCGALESMTLPFVGRYANATTSSTDTLFGYIFGTTAYTGGVSTSQNSSSSSRTYYIPQSLTSVTITGGNLFYGAFHNCKYITNIVLPNSATSIPGYAFYNCAGLKNVQIPSSVRTIGYRAFSDSGLTSIVIPEGVESLDQSFFSCGSLKEVTIPSTLKSSTSATFERCESLTAVYITDLVAWCNIDFVTSGNPLSTAGNLYLNGELITDLVIPNSITELKPYVFYGGDCFKSITIHNGVTSIGSYTFGACQGLTDIQIPNSVEVIDSYAFNYCQSLTTVTFAPNSKLTSIEKGAFMNARSLTSIVIPNGVTTIADQAFYQCKGLTSVTIPNTVTYIGASLFFFANDMHEIIFTGTVQEWQSMEKDSNWAATTANDLKILCTDGEVTRSGTVTYYETT